MKTVTLSMPRFPRLDNGHTHIDMTGLDSESVVGKPVLDANGNTIGEVVGAVITSQGATITAHINDDAAELGIGVWFGGD